MNLQSDRDLETDAGSRPRRRTDDPTHGAKPPLAGRGHRRRRRRPAACVAWVGGRDFSKSQFDHISMARRENGALLQPLLYALGLRPARPQPGVDDQRVVSSTRPCPRPGRSRPRQPGDRPEQVVSFRPGCARSRQQARRRRASACNWARSALVDWLQQGRAGAGATSRTDKPNVFNPDPMTLGDMASLYQVLGNDGVHRKLKIIQSIESRDGPGALRGHASPTATTTRMTCSTASTTSR